MSAGDVRPPKFSDELKSAPQDRVRIEHRRHILIDNYLQSAQAFGEDAEERSLAALGALREEPERAITEIARTLGETHTEDFPTRSLLIFAAGALEHPSALPLLIDLANEPIPPEPNPPAHGLGTTAHEIILRTTAVDGAGAIARVGDERAQQALLDLVGSSVFSIRRAAVQSLLSAERGAAIRRQIRALLPPDLHFLLELKAVPVEDVTQPDAERFLRPDRTEMSAPPDPAALSERAPTDAPPSRRRKRRGQR